MNHLSTQNPKKIQEWYACSDHTGVILLLLLVSMIVVLTQCTTPMSQKKAMVPNRPEKKVFKIKPDVLKEAVERVLGKKKFTLDANQSNELHLQTKWLEDQSYRSRVVADIKPLSRTKSELTLMMYLEKKLVFLNKWKPMDEIGEDTYSIMLGDIEMECYRVLYDRT